ncbi:hypothetical protein COLO4_02367 [Corchorus olitorius]|uniref:Uncharacterized protein n=1 Tax=Corchorus olitorius TaxID=93759 RepID=A0A1R3L177_9ROSI|nr:hypothetical protein COLO4_02367 [Corchorus olitorius]
MSSDPRGAQLYRRSGEIASPRRPCVGSRAFPEKSPSAAQRGHTAQVDGGHDRMPRHLRLRRDQHGEGRRAGRRFAWGAGASFSGQDAAAAIFLPLDAGSTDRRSAKPHTPDRGAAAGSPRSVPLFVARLFRGTAVRGDDGAHRGVADGRGTTRGANTRQRAVSCAGGRMLRAPVQRRDPRAASADGGQSNHGAVTRHGRPDRAVRPARLFSRDVGRVAVDHRACAGPHRRQLSLGGRISQ